MNLKVKDNLFIIENKVISYETPVATIKEGQIVAHGKYSRSTGKQLAHLSRLTGLPLQPSNEKRAFYQFELGVRCLPFCRIDVSVNSAKKILTNVKHTGDILSAAAMTKDELRKADAIAVERVLSSKGWTNEQIDAFKTLNLILE